MKIVQKKNKLSDNPVASWWTRRVTVQLDNDQRVVVGYSHGSGEPMVFVKKTRETQATAGKWVPAKECRVI